jgi:hypothetical protein
MINFVVLFILHCLYVSIHSSYNPIPFSSIIVSTTRTISVMQPAEYAGNNRFNIIYTAKNQTTIVCTMFEPLTRDLYVLFVNNTYDGIYIARLRSMEKLDSMIYKLPISFQISNINRLTMFTSDIVNRRAFLTDHTGRVTMFSLSGAMSMNISRPSSIITPIRAVVYHSIYNRLFIVTDSTVNSCTGLDENYFQCCPIVLQTEQLRSITFDAIDNQQLAYVIDAQTGIYQIILNSTGCPIGYQQINSPGTLHQIYLVTYRDLYISSGSNDDSNHNSILSIYSRPTNLRTIAIDTSIVALHVSHSKTTSNMKTQETCFRGITYRDYRLAVLLAALFGTIMGLFMCFNALFCLDFFMTKRIISDLKQQIPNNVFENRWKRLVDEKYAKLALDSKSKS